MGAAVPSQAADDYLTTDFQVDLQPQPGLQIFYQPGVFLTPSSVKGTVLPQRYGVMITPIRGLDLFAYGQHLGLDVKRTNRYAFNMAGRDLGLRFAVLPEWRNPVGVDVGVVHEANYPNHIFRNGSDLLLTSPSDSCLYTFVLATRKVSPTLRLNAGVEWGQVRVGPQLGNAWSWSLGSEHALRPDLDLGLNLKQLYLQGQSTNEQLSARLRWKPIEALRVQLEGSLYTHGLRAQVPALVPYSTVSFSQSFESKAMAAVQLDLSYRFDWVKAAESAAPARPAAEAKPAPSAPDRAPASQGQGAPGVAPR